MRGLITGPECVAVGLVTIVRNIMEANGWYGDALHGRENNTKSFHFPWMTSESQTFVTRMVHDVQKLLYGGASFVIQDRTREEDRKASRPETRVQGTFH